MLTAIPIPDTMSLINRNTSESVVALSNGDGIRVPGSALLVDIARAFALSPYPLLAVASEHDSAFHGPDGTLADCLARETTCERINGGVMCALTHSTTCAARESGSEHHSILGEGPCWRASCSATAAALVALEADLEIRTPDASQWVAVEEFLASPNRASSTVPRANAAVLAARIPAAAAAGFQRLSFPTGGQPLTSRICVAATRRTDGEARIVIGGVSPSPYRVYTSVEEEAIAGGLDEDTITGLAERALLDSDADPRSATQVEVVAGLLREIIREVAGS